MTGHPYRYVVHDRDAIFSSGLDAELKDIGVRVLKTPVRAPQVNAFCERLIGTIRRECLDFLIPLGEGHLKRILREWVGHYKARTTSFLFRTWHPGATPGQGSGQLWTTNAHLRVAFDVVEA